MNLSAELLSHRGPDNSGIFANGAVGLAHTRLSLVDLNTRSNQPFWDSTGRFCLIFNGEIYNFRDLRQNLEKQGVAFKTTSDTEVLLHCLIQDGAEATLPRLEGMFAFAFYDKQEASIVLARDRFGIKPLVVYQDDSIFLFTSEIKALRPWVNLVGNPLSISSFLLGGSGPAQNACFYQNVRIVPPGSVVNLTVGEKPKFTRFARLTDMLDGDQAEELRRLKPAQVVDQVDELLQKSVERMLAADAPVGALCSGGVDSSLLMAIAARRHRNLAIFHADVVGPLSEYGAARKLASHLKLNLEKVEVRDQDFIDLLPVTTWYNEHPIFRNQHSLPFMMVSKLVHEHGVKAVLTGEGSDECFLGYGNIALQQPLVDFYFRQAARLSRLVRRIPTIGPLLLPNTESLKLVADMLGQFERPLEDTDIRETYAGHPGLPNDRNNLTLELLSYNLRMLLQRNDLMGMSASLEARFPFLDERLVKTAVNLPFNTKIRFSPSTLEKNHPFSRDKWVLREVADRYMPKELSQRKKIPFTVNAYGRMKIPSSYFKNSFIRDYLELGDRELNFLLEKADQTLKVKLLMLDVWGSVCLRNETVDRVRENLLARLSY